MPSGSLEIRVSRREADRPRLLQAVASDAGVRLRIEVDANGTFSEELEQHAKELVTGGDGSAIFQWYEWPRNAPARDFVSVVTVSWDDASVRAYLEDLFE
jgi:hypothetical protein